jgi:hypothetical protein
MTIQDAIAQVTSNKTYFTTTEVTKVMSNQGVTLTPFKVSQQLKDQGYYFEVIGGVRHYKPRPSTKLEETLRILVTTWDCSKLVTMKFVKNYLKQSGVEFTNDEFNHYFIKLGFEFSGEYNKENHKLYRIRKDGTHFSKTEQDFVAIDKMHPTHIFNLIQQKYPNTLVKDCFTRSSEIYQLLKAYFLYNIRETVKLWFK